MYYKKIGQIIRDSTPKEKKPRFTPEQIEKFKTVSSTVLVIIGIVGVVTLAAVAPSVGVVFNRLMSKKYGYRKFSKKEKDEKIAQVFYYMKRTRQIKMKFTGKDFKIMLTKLGKRKFKKLQFENLQIEKPKKWDKKMWQVAADIPTRYKLGADYIREKLKNMGFFPLQRTLWFYPFDPRAEVEFIASHYGVGNFVTVMEVNRLDKFDESRMLKYFRKEEIF